MTTTELPTWLAEGAQVAIFNRDQPEEPPC